MVKLGLDHVENIVSEIKQLKLAKNIDPNTIDQAADKVLQN